MPECRKILVMDATETDDESLIGEECHIIARKKDGPRGKSELSTEQRDKYNNLLLLCRNHHKVIDDQPSEYSVEKLHSIKDQHEKWVRESLEEYDSAKQRDEEIYAEYIEKWIDKAGIDKWEDWSFYALSHGQPRLHVEFETKLQEVSTWIFSRIWPKRYLDLEQAFENYRVITQDFLAVFHQYSTKAEDCFCTEKFYKIPEWNEERYKMLVIMYEFHVNLVEDLMLELTRAANYICDKIRKYIDPSFRLEEGLILVVGGPYLDFSMKHYRVEYRGEQRSIFPYPGLEQFKIDRETRDIHFGVGIDTNDPKFKEWYRTRE